MRSPEFLDPDPSVETEYDDTDPGPLDEDEEPVSFEDEHPDPEPGLEADDDGGEITEDDDAAEPVEDEADSAEPRTPVPPEGTRETRWVALDELQLERRFWSNPRTITGLGDGDLAALAENIKLKTTSDETDMYAGIDEPMLVVQILSNGSIEQLVLDGQRRFKAAELAFGDLRVLVPVRDREPEPVEWSEALARKYLQEVLTSVGLRHGLSAFELSEAAMHLRGTKDETTGKELTIAAVGRIIGRSESWTSKILTARNAASPKLLARWRKGEISEEQFRDLAVGAKGEEQEQEADKVAEARASGDKAGARLSAKEKKEIARREAQAKKDKAKADKEAAKAKKKADKEAARTAKAQAKQKGKGKKGPVVSGPQSDLPLSPAEIEKPAPAPAKPKAMQAVIVDDLIAMTEKKPPTHDLVKGVILGILVATGRKDMADLPKQWHQYINHVSGTAPAKKGKRK